MRQNRTYFLIFILFITCFLKCQEIKLITEDLPPLNYLDKGELKGPSIQIIKEIQKKLNLDIDIKVLPWARAYRIASVNPNIGLFSTTKTKERDKIFKWVGPLAEKKFVFFAKKNSNITIKNIEDAKTIGRIGVVLEDVSEQDLTARGFTNLDAVSTPALNPRKLLKNRISLWYTSSITGKNNCENAGIPYEKFKIVYTVKTSKLYLAFSKKTSDKIVKKWQKAYDSLYNNGIINKIYNQANLKVLYPAK